MSRSDIVITGMPSDGLKFNSRINIFSPTQYTMDGLEDCKQINVPFAGLSPGKMLFECIPPPDLNDLAAANAAASARLTFTTVVGTFLAIVAVMIVLYLLWVTSGVERLDAISRYDQGAQIGITPGADIVLRGESLRA